MPKYILSAPQKALLILAYCIFVLGIAAIIAIVVIHLQSNAPKPITVFDHSGMQLSYASYDKTITFPNIFMLKWGDNVGLFTANSEVEITSTQVQVMSGAGLVKIGRDEAALQDTFATSHSIVALLPQTTKVYVLLGLISYQGSALPAGTEWDYKAALVSAQNIARDVFNSNADLSELRENAAIVSADIPWLTDFTAPKLTNVSPAPAALVSTEQIKLVGQIDDVDAKVKVNNTMVPNTGGNFELTLQLISGSNLIIIELTDLYGNNSSHEVRIIYQPSATPE